MQIISENVVIKGNTSTTLAIFDLDDTLVVTSAKIKVVDKKTGKVIRELSPAEFNSFEENPKKHVLSFEDFENPEILEQGQMIQNIFRFLRNWYKKGIPISIITARSSSDMVRNFFLKKGIDIHPELVIAVNDSKYDFTGPVEEKKKQAMISLIDKGFSHLIFFDDHAKNLEEAKSIERIRKDVTVSVYQV
jgi:FMN phosphatase YigB (HAD superfamily)